ncbi:MAG: carboxymuconolactone decarboxylase family protein [Planctomycetota bacterium]|jgi:AhpD family alkylhydroperoxidase
MDKKIEEMIALGVAYGINCTACLEYHKKEAVRAGLTAEEMLAAITVAKQVKAGAAKKTEAVATELIGQADEGPCCRPGSECCP